MSRQQNRRSLVNVSRPRRIRSTRAADRPRRTDRRPPRYPVGEEGALTLLSEILTGDRAWTMAEVQSLISMRESAELGRWRPAGLDE